MPARIPTYRAPGPTPAPLPRPDRRDSERRRDTVQFITGKRWRRVRALHLQSEPLCRDCKARGRLTEASQVHHIVARHIRPDLALDDANLMSLCAPCHGARTARGE